MATSTCVASSIAPDWFVSDVHLRITSLVAPRSWLSRNIFCLAHIFRDEHYWGLGFRLLFLNTIDRLLHRYLLLTDD